MRDEHDEIFISIVEIFLRSILGRERERGKERKREVHEVLNIRGVTFWLLTRDNKIYARYLRREVDLAEKFLITRAFCHSLLINRSIV